MAEAKEELEEEVEVVEEEAVVPVEEEEEAQIFPQIYCILV